LCSDDWDLNAYALTDTEKQLVADILSSTAVEAHGREESTSNGEDGTANCQKGSIIADEADRDPTDSCKDGFSWSVVHDVDLEKKFMLTRADNQWEVSDTTCSSRNSVNRLEENRYVV